MDELQIDITTDIGGWGFTFDDLKNRLSGFNGNNIRVPINSYGGSVLEGIAIYNTLLGRKEHVETHIIGYAMSMGTVLACAGDECTMPENGYYMIHNPLNLAIGDHREMEHQVEILRMMKEDIAQIYKRKTGLSISQIKQWMDEEKWFTAKEAKKYGFVDRLTKGAQFEASFTPKDLEEYTNIPQALLANNNFKEEKKSNMTSLFDKVKAYFKKDFNDEKEAIAFMDDNDIQAIVEEKTKGISAAIEANFAEKFESVKNVEGLDEIKAELKDANDKIEVLNGLSEQFEDVKASLGNALNEFKTLKEENEVFQNKVAEMETTESDLKKVVEDLKGENEELKKQNADVIKEAADLKAAVNKKAEVKQTTTVINYGSATKGSEAFKAAFSKAMAGE